MSKENPSNVSASIKNKLLNKSKEQNRLFQEILQYYAMERFLYRFSKSKHINDFILKGGVMLTAWKSPITRPTKDIDFLAKTSNEISHIIKLIEEVCLVEYEEDGMRFDSRNIKASHIKEDAVYEGVRVNFTAYLGKASVPMQVDIGFDDIVYPGKTEIEFPTILELPAPTMNCYTRESVIAEKFEAMVKLDILNSRMKDFYDIWLLSSNFEFDGSDLCEAIKRTFEHRETRLDEEITAFTEEFVNEKQIQWDAFRKKIKQEKTPKSLADIIAHIKLFLLPIIVALKENSQYAGTWMASKVWNSN